MIDTAGGLDQTADADAALFAAALLRWRRWSRTLLVAAVHMVLYAGQQLAADTFSGGGGSHGDRSVVEVADVGG